MSAANFSPEIMAKIKEVTAMTYTDQAIFYLNAFWKDGADAEAETCWELVQAFIKEDHVKGKNGNELNPIQAFNVLQKRSQTLTALELKAQLRTVDIDANGEMALAEYLLFINKRDPIKFVTNPQGEVDPVLLKQVEDKLAALEREFEELQQKQAAAKQAELAAKSAESEAIRQEEAAKVAEQQAIDSARAAKAAEDALKKIEDEARAIEAEIKREEQAKADNIARLEALSVDQSVGIVKRNMAVQELAAAKGADSLPLQKAKLTQEAVVRRLAKATAVAAEETAKANAAADAATEARKAAEAARAKAVEARQAAEAAVRAVEAAIESCQVAIKAVEQELETLKASSGAPMGLLWWNSRIIEDKKRSLPTRMW